LLLAGEDEVFAKTVSPLLDIVDANLQNFLELPKSEVGYDTSSTYGSLQYRYTTRMNSLYLGYSARTRQYRMYAKSSPTAKMNDVDSFDLIDGHSSRLASDLRPCSDQVSADC
jgi:hypothetical protein